MSPNAILILLAALLALAGLLLNLTDRPHGRVARFFVLHGETVLYATVFVLALAVLGPALDRYDEARHAAQVASK